MKALMLATVAPGRQFGGTTYSGAEREPASAAPASASGKLEPVARKTESELANDALLTATDVLYRSSPASLVTLAIPGRRRACDSIAGFTTPGPPTTMAREAPSAVMSFVVAECMLFAAPSTNRTGDDVEPAAAAADK